MKKLLFNFVSLAMLLLGVCLISQPVAAATDPGQSIIQNLQKGANNGALKVNEVDLNQATNYVRTAKITANQAKIVNQNIDQARQLIDVYAPRATNYSEVGTALSSAQKERLRQMVYRAAQALSLTVSFGQPDSSTSANVTNQDDAADSKNTGALPTSDTDSNVAPTLTDKAGRVVYQPASTTGNSNGATTIVKQTGGSYFSTYLVVGILIALLGAGFYWTRKPQKAQG